MNPQAREIPDFFRMFYFSRFPHFWKTVRVLFFSIISMLLVLWGILWTLVPVSSLYQQQVEQSISDFLDAPFTFETVEAELNGTILSLSLQGANAKNQTGEKILLFEEMHAEINLLQSLLAWEWITNELILWKPQLAVHKRTDGQMTVNGFVMIPASVDAQTHTKQQQTGQHIEQTEISEIEFWLDSLEELGWLWKQPYLRLEQATFSWKIDHPAGQLHWALPEINSVIRNGKARHQLSGTAQVGTGGQGTLQLEADWTGAWNNPRNWQGVLHIQGESVEMKNLLGGSESPWPELIQGQRDLSFWGVHGGTGNWEVVTDLAVAENQTTNQGLLDGQIAWKRSGDGNWRLGLSNFFWSGYQPLTVLIEQQVSQNGETTWLGQTEQLDLSVLNPFLHNRGIQYLFPQLPAQFDIGGSLEQANFRLLDHGKTWMDRLRVEATLNQLSAKQINTATQFAGISGKIQWRKNAGEFIYPKNTIQLAHHHIAPELLHMELTPGVVSWTKQSQGWQVSAKEIHLSDGNLIFNSDLSLFLEEGKSPLIDANTGFSVHDTAPLFRNLSQSTLGQQEIWLQYGIRQAELVNGKVILRGYLDQFPYHQEEGEFKVTCDIHNAEVRFMRNWPLLKNANAQFQFDHHGMNVAIHSGEIAGNPVQQANVKIRSFQKKELEVDVQLASESRNLIHLLERGVLQKRLESRSLPLYITGIANLDVNMFVPLHNPKQTQIQGTLQLTDNQLHLPDLDLRAEKLSGAIAFTKSTITAEQINGQMLGGPIRISASTQQQSRINNPTQSDSHFVKLVLKGKSNLHHWPPWQQWINPKKQKNLEPQKHSMWHSIGIIPLSAFQENEKQPIRFLFRSDLEGVAIPLPKPLQKQVGERWPTMFNAEIGQTLDMQFMVDQRLQASVIRENSETELESKNIWRASVSLGDSLYETKTPQPATKAVSVRDGISLQGEFKTLSLQPWLETIRDLMDRKQDANSSIPLQQANLKIGELNAYSKPLQKVTLHITPQKSQNHKQADWQVQIDSNQLTGNILIPAENKKRGKNTDRPIVFNLKHIALQTNDTNETENDAANDTEKKQKAASQNDTDTFFDLRTVPKMKITSNHLLVDQKDWGKLQLDVKPTKAGILVHPIHLSSELLDAEATLYWDKQQNEHPQRSSVALKIQGDALSKVLDRLSSQQGIMQKGKFALAADVAWEGSPMQFMWPRSSGVVQIHVAEGNMIDLDQGIGRVLSLLGVHTLLRRLSLDFSDVSDQGFPFDSITGNLTIQNGIAQTNDLTIDGMAAKIRIVGNSDLAARTYDHTVFVTPKISETLPVTGALVAGPTGVAIGSALWLTEKVLKRNKGIVSKEYLLTGSWDNPQIEEKRAGVLGALFD